MQTSEQKSSSSFLKTDGGKTKSNTIEVPSISLPKRGGAIKGIDEKFSVNAVNDSSSFSIPLPFSPARGASPQLALSYSSGDGNGIFSIGWNLSLGSIRRKTDKGLPQYLKIYASYAFQFSDFADFVPEVDKNNRMEIATEMHDIYNYTGLGNLKLEYTTNILKYKNYEQDNR